LRELPAAFFDVIVFSLVLSYIPSAEKRTEAVWKARRLLRPGGLLLIITPFSTIRLTNSIQLPIMREWRTAMEAMALVFRNSENLVRAKQIGLAYVANEETRPEEPRWFAPMRIAFDGKEKGK